MKMALAITGVLFILPGIAEARAKACNGTVATRTGPNGKVLKVLPRRQVLHLPAGRPAARPLIHGSQALLRRAAQPEVSSDRHVRRDADIKAARSYCIVRMVPSL
jgi:hypothetical protein